MNLKFSCLGFLGAEITDVRHHTQLSRDTLANTETQNNPQREFCQQITNMMEENLKQKETKSQETQLLYGTNMRGVIRGQK